MLKDWLGNRWLRQHATTRAEIADLLSVVARDIKDASAPISPDWRFGIAYNAAIKLCTILLYAEGYRAARELQHYRTIAAMPLVLGEGRTGDAEYLETCRKKRNIAEYEQAGRISGSEADELLVFVKSLRSDIIEWLSEKHPELTCSD
jgi:hypothetical protein